MKHIVFLLIILLSSCVGHQKNEEESRFLSIPVNYNNKNVFELSSLSDNVINVKLETNDSCLIKDIKKIFYIDDKIIIGSENVILFFDKSGAFKYSINRQGVGPEEYLRLSDFDISPDRERISVLDTRKKVILEYDLLGNFRKKRNLDNWYIGLQYLSDSLCILYSGNQVSGSNTMKFSIYDMEKSSLIDSFYPISEPKSKYLHIHSANNFSKSLNELLFCELYNDTIYTVASSGYAPLYYLDFGKHKIPSSLLNDSYGNIMEFQNKLTDYEFSYGINSLVCIPNGLFVSYYDRKKKCFIFIDRKANHITSFRRITDKKIFGDFVIDALKYQVKFYSDRNYLFVIANNELFIDGRESFVNSTLKSQFNDIKFDDNPVIRICKVPN